MKVLIDADGCPVVNIAVRICLQYTIPCILLCDTAHSFHLDGATTLTLDKGSDSVDFALVNRICQGDVVITQDYGLASMCLARNASVIHQDGWLYTADNIDALLLQRHTARKLRAAGSRMKGPNKRHPSQDKSFTLAFEKLIQQTVHG